MKRRTEKIKWTGRVSNADVWRRVNKVLQNFVPTFAVGKLTEMVK